MDKAGRELRDRRRRLRRSGGVLVRFLGNVRDLSERSELSPRRISKSRTSARFPDPGENFPVRRARRAAYPEQRTLALGFLSGCEPEWLPAVMHVLRDELPKIEVTISSRHSPQLAEDLATGKLDAAFIRPEEHPDLVYRVLITEPLIVVLPSDHRLASHDAIQPLDFVGETFIGMADQAPVLRSLIEDYFRRSGIDLHPTHRVEYLSMAISLVASTRGLALLPDFARNFLTWSVVSRPLAGEAPAIDLVLGYHKANNSPLLRLFLSRTEEMIGRVSKRPS